jgi:heterodisulfide reductase subunit A2
MNGEVVVIGGGSAGMAAASQLSLSGLHVTLVDKEKQVGGHLVNWHRLFPDRRDGNEVIEYLGRGIDDGNIRLVLNSEVISLTKNGNTITTLTSGGESFVADAVVVATGFDLFNSSRKEEYGYGIYDNVITSSELEKMFREGKITLNNGLIPEKIGFIHCVGSRDEKVGNLYCSKLCCVTAVKQAIEVKEHLPESRITCFYMDMRMGGAHYEELYREAQENYDITFIRGKVSEVGVNIDNKLIIKSEDTLAGRPLRMELDMVVLMAGMEVSSGGARLADKSGLKRGENRFLEPADSHFGNNWSNIRGVFYAGTCTAPMNITETISHARAAAFEVINYLTTSGK